MSILKKFIEINDVRSLKIAIIGDSMIDEYYKVNIKKISPEFPIPVMQSDVDFSENLPGGAANVAYQFSKFNLDVNLFSFLDDESRFTLFTKNIDTKLCVSIPTKIPRKKRFYSGDFPTYRWDVEQFNYGLGEKIDEKINELYLNLYKNIDVFDVVVFSDYDKGVFKKQSKFDLNNLIKKSKISIVDPKIGNLDSWSGCTVFKPNKQESLVLSGKSNVLDAGKFILDKLNCKAVIITQSDNGISIFQENETLEIKPSSKIKAQSVIGAGDCYSSFLAMALGHGMSINESAELAFQASSLYVKNLHNKPLSKNDLISLYDSSFLKTNFNLNSIKNRNYKLVFTNGCFDVLHKGHVETLKYAKSKGDKLIVAINSDESIKKLKGNNRPIVPLDQRMSVVAALDVVDFVVSFNEDTPLNLIEKLMPDVLVKGSDYQLKDIVGAKIVPEVYGAPFFDGLSSTSIIEKIKNTI